MNKLEDIGFYTLSDERARSVSHKSPLQRCELILTDKCNFHCPYCRGLNSELKGTMPWEKAIGIIDLWADEGLKNIRFSGGEPTLYPFLSDLVIHSKMRGIERIAISTNGSAPLGYYKNLIEFGVNDVSISLDACCSAMGERMNGDSRQMWNHTIEIIRELSRLTYVTVGVVFTPDNIGQSKETIEFADKLGVSDIRILSSAQYNEAIGGLDSLDSKILDRHPILKYRVNNFRNNRNVRGIKEDDSQLCYLVLDDMAIAGDYHFPCIIYMREGGDPIGRVSPKMRVERHKWFMNHETHRDLICRENCLDVCIDHNNRVQGLQRLPERLDGSNLDWQAWRHGTPSEIGLQCRYHSLCSVEGKRIIREKCIGWCPGEETLARPKRNQTGIAFFHNDEKFWFHIRNHEFKEIFPELT